MRLVTVIALSAVFFVSDWSQAADARGEQGTRNYAGGGCTFLHARSDAHMPDDIAAELRRLQRNQTALLVAVNQLIAQTAPISANPSGYVTKGLVVDAEGFIVLGTIPAPEPRTTLRGIRAGDPLWIEPPPSP